MVPEYLVPEYPGIRVPRYVAYRLMKFFMSGDKLWGIALILPLHQRVGHILYFMFAECL